jgi:hypothetical protein
MKLDFLGVGVDAGIIMICDEEYYEKYGYQFDEKLSKKVNVPIGNYECYWNIPHTWNGTIEGTGNVNITSGNLIVSDPCYCIQTESDSQWMKFLDDTDYGKKPEHGTIIIDKTGGDGLFNVYIKLTKVGD